VRLVPILEDCGTGRGRLFLRQADCMSMRIRLLHHYRQAAWEVSAGPPKTGATCAPSASLCQIEAVLFLTICGPTTLRPRIEGIMLVFSPGICPVEAVRQIFRTIMGSGGEQKCLASSMSSAEAFQGFHGSGVANQETVDAGDFKQSPQTFICTDNGVLMVHTLA